MLTITVAASSSAGEAAPYPIHLGAGLINSIGELIAPKLARQRVTIVTDTNVAALYLPSIAASLDSSGISFQVIEVPAGEGSKSFHQLEQVCEAMLAARLERTDTVIALGGGVVGDLASFAASIVLRGVSLVSVPTTLLAQVDSSIGGKTAINARCGKNLIGSFYNPKLVIADTNVLSTLGEREARSGYAEVIKYGVLGDAAFFDWLCNNHRAIARGDDDSILHMVSSCCRQKAKIVASDPHEHGERALLNLGHTFAHAFEALSGYGGALTHGEAVAAGMVEAAMLSARLGLCQPGDAQRVERHIAEAGLPTGVTAIAASIENTTNPNLASLPSKIITAMTTDKKVRGGNIGLILLRGIGKAFVSWEVDKPTLHTHLATRLGLE